VGKRNACSVFKGNPKEKRKLVRPRHRLKDKLRMNHKEIRWEMLLSLHAKPSLELVK
jgi:hypothetical protein